jgi:hypothetical protein
MRTEGFKGVLLSTLIIASLLALSISFIAASPALVLASDTEQQIVVNGDFSTGDATGWIFGVATGFGPLGNYEIVDYTARVYRYGAGSSGRGSWLYQDPNIDVSNATELTLSFDVKVDYQSLSGLGYADEEPPAYVEISYLDDNGQAKYVYWAFYYEGTSADPNAEKIPQSTWVDRSYDLTSLSPKPAVITRVYTVASGWDYDSRFDNVSIIYRGPRPVGGIAFTPDKLALLAPYIILAALIAIVTVSVAVYWRRLIARGG